MSGYVHLLRSRYQSRKGLVFRLLQPAVAVRNMLKRLAPRQSLPAWVCRGRERRSGLNLVCLYIGNDEQRAYLKRTIFDGAVIEHYLGPRWLWNIRSALGARRRIDASFEFDQLPGLTNGVIDSERCLVLPEWVWGEYVADAVDPGGRVMNKRRRRVQNWHYHYEVTSEPAAIRRFIDEMVVPHYKQRYGDEALGFAPDDVPWDTRDLELLLVTLEGDAVAGTLIVYDAGSAVLWRTGVRNGDPALVRRGALQAVNYFRHEYLLRKGVARVQAGGTKPFFNDGALAYKRTWGLRLTGSWRNEFVLRVRRDDTAARSFLVNNPFVTWHDGKLAAAVFVTHDSPPAEDALEPLRSFLWPGIDHVVAYYFGPASGGDADALHSAVPGVVARAVPIAR